MTNQSRHTFRKAERLCSKKRIETLFAGSRAISAYPLRVVFRKKDEEQPTQLLITVSKRHFKHAVDRNRIKRLIREAYRLNKQILLDAPSMQGKSLDLAFIWISDELSDFCTIESRVKNLLQRISENLEA
ncbi:MAG: ribonuclease P protein component [Bacteroidaceae bacterium]|nr:ribonuclease P protein component [Bacteroidaceae bacterium]